MKNNYAISELLRQDDTSPFLTVAIPHYKHRYYLEIVLKSIAEQQFDDFEIVISDDCSPDDSAIVLPKLLQQMGKPFRYYLQTTNLGYDGNVRFCLSAAQGRYVLLLGNDDALDGAMALDKLAAALQQLNYPSVAFCNFADWLTGSITRRAQQTAILGSGPRTALRFYRSFSFVSGLIFDRLAANQHSTDRWDRSIYYQIYLACRIIAAGGTVAGIALSTVRKDVQIDGQTVATYATKASSAPWSYQSRHTGVDSVIRVAIDGIVPYVTANKQSAIVRRIIAQAYLILYPYWLLEYRRVANWSYAVGIARGLWPSSILSEHKLKLYDRMGIWLLYLVVTAAGLSIPVALFTNIRGQLAEWLRHSQQRIRQVS